MQMTVITSADIPAPAEPYSQAIKAGGFLFVSGQLPLDEHGEVVSGGIEEQTIQVFKNLRAVLNEAGLMLFSVVKTTVYMKNLKHLPAMDNVYGAFFRNDQPARSCVQASYLPKGCLIEIEAVALY